MYSYRGAQVLVAVEPVSLIDFCFFSMHEQWRDDWCYHCDGNPYAKP